MMLSALIANHPSVQNDLMSTTSSFPEFKDIIVIGYPKRDFIVTTTARVFGSSSLAHQTDFLASMDLGVLPRSWLEGLVSSRHS